MTSIIYLHEVIVNIEYGLKLCIILFLIYLINKYDVIDSFALSLYEFF